MESQEERNAPDIQTTSKNTRDDSANLASSGSNQPSLSTSPGGSSQLSPSVAKGCTAQGEAHAPAGEPEATEGPVPDEDVTYEMLFEMAEEPLDSIVKGDAPSDDTASDKAPPGVTHQAHSHTPRDSPIAQLPSAHSVRVLSGLCTGGSTTLAEGCFFDLIDVNNRESSATS